MKYLVNTILVAGMVTGVSLTSAHGADYKSGITTTTPSTEFTPVEFGSGWYIRGDITYNFSGQSNTTFSSITGPTTSSFQADYDDAVGARIGFGYYMSNNLRVDFSAEAMFDSSYGMSGPATFSAIDNGGNPVLADGTSQITGEYSSQNFAINAYWDLARMGAFTPYVGGGVGLARISQSFNLTETCSPIATVACLSPAGAQGVEVTSNEVFSDDQWTHSFQLTAGTAIAIDDKTSFDISYTYSTIGDGGEIEYSNGRAVNNEGFDVHQLRVGLRHDIW